MYSRDCCCHAGFVPWVGNVIILNLRALKHAKPTKAEAAVRVQRLARGMKGLRDLLLLRDWNSRRADGGLGAAFALAGTLVLQETKGVVSTPCIPNSHFPLAHSHMPSTLLAGDGERTLMDCICQATLRKRPCNSFNTQ